MVRDFRDPLFPDVLEGGGRHDGEADEKHVRLRIRQRTESVVVLLAGGVKQPQGVGLSPDHDGHGVVVKDGGDVFGGEFVGRVGNQETRFADGTISHDNAFDCLHFQGSC